MTNQLRPDPAMKAASQEEGEKQDMEPLVEVTSGDEGAEEEEVPGSSKKTLRVKISIAVTLGMAVTAMLVGVTWTLLRSKKPATAQPSNFSAQPPNFSAHLQSLQFHSGVDSYDAAFRLALQEVHDNIQDDGRFIAGAGWTQLWTRDTSYALQLSLALLYPEVSQRTLQNLTQESPPFGTTWLQDVCGHFGGWPNLSDAIVGATGAWSLYLATGNVEFLQWAHNVTLRTLEWAEAEVFWEGLFRGCSSFMESNSGYPAAYKGNGTMVGQTKALSTNILYYMGYKVAANMTRELHRVQKISAQDSGVQITELTSKADQLRQAIQSRFWMEEHGYYSYFEDAQGQPISQMEGLGESLLLLAPELEQNQTRIDLVFSNTVRTDKGIPCLWPRFEIPETKDVSNYYHNGRIWPFVQGYWALAAAHHKRGAVFGQELDHLVDLTGIRLANNPNATFAEFYELDGSFLPERRRQLWSSAGYLGMILQGLFGIQLQANGSIRLQPIKPKNNYGMAETIVLEGLPYRNHQAVFTIHVTGYGTELDRVRVNGKVQKEAFLAADDVHGELFIELSLKEAS